MKTFRVIALVLSLAVISQTQSPPTTWIDLVLASPAAKSANVTWRTAVPANGKVKYGTTTSYGKSTPVLTDLVGLHKVTITGLTPKTTYHVKTISQDADKVQQVLSKDVTFTTSAHAAIVKWGASSTPSVTYSVYRSGSQNGPWTQLAAGILDLEKIDSTVTAGQIVWYTIKAVNSAGVESAQSQPIKATIPTP